MKHKLRPLTDQVIVIAGASSGIGLVTARRAAQRSTHQDHLRSRSYSLSAEKHRAISAALAPGAAAGLMAGSARPTRPRRLPLSPAQPHASTTV